MDESRRYWQRSRATIEHTLGEISKLATGAFEANLKLLLFNTSEVFSKRCLQRNERVGYEKRLQSKQSISKFVATSSKEGPFGA